ncbi:MAG TPA: general stress protein [Candidatus Angelobacter sp.]|jgi:hypothetical protein|nr:general stress protein [Candidatus Angelobacter sp.]
MTQGTAAGVAATPVTMPSNLSVVGVYDDMAQAEKAIQQLIDAGLARGNVSVIGQGLQSEARVNGFVTTGDVAKTGAKVGAWVGGIFGLLTGVAVLFVPGVGPIVALGPLAGAALGAAETATFTGIVGAIFGHFLAKQHIPKFEAHLRAGRYLLVVHGSNDEVARARQIMQSTGAKDITENDAATAA